MEYEITIQIYSREGKTQLVFCKTSLSLDEARLPNWSETRTKWAKTLNEGISRKNWNFEKLYKDWNLKIWADFRRAKFVEKGTKMRRYRVRYEKFLKIIIKYQWKCNKLWSIYTSFEPENSRNFKTLLEDQKSSKRSFDSKWKCGDWSRTKNSTTNKIR